MVFLHIKSLNERTKKVGADVTVLIVFSVNNIKYGLISILKYHESHLINTMPFNARYYWRPYLSTFFSQECLRLNLHIIKVHIYEYIHICICYSYDMFRRFLFTHTCTFTRIHTNRAHAPLLQTERERNFRHLGC